MFFHKTYILLWQNDIVNTLNLTSSCGNTAGSTLDAAASEEGTAISASEAPVEEETSENTEASEEPEVVESAEDGPSEGASGWIPRANAHYSGEPRIPVGSPYPM